MQSSSDFDLDAVRSQVLDHLAGLGFGFDGKRLVTESDLSKATIRQMHRHAVAERVEQAEKALRHREAEFVDRLMPGDQITPSQIRPKLVLVDEKGTFESHLWRWASLHWSIPTSLGYGRRLRYLVLDEGHADALLGVIGLQDPVFAQNDRDETIGWDDERRQGRLVDLMDAFVVGAVPPYSGLLGGKLVALAATSIEVRADFERIYRHKTTRITGRDPDARLLAITTASALGRSSVYNRLKSPDGSLAYEPFGWTAGTGDFHFSGEIYDTLHEVARAYFEPTARPRAWGEGWFRNRREVIQRAMQVLDLPWTMRKHGVKRQLFIARTAENALGVLNGSVDAEPIWRTRSVVELGEWWLDRWALGRADRMPDYKSFDPETWRLWPDPAKESALVAS